MDNDLRMRALMSEIPTIDMNARILHQEHKGQKEKQLKDPQERERALELNLIKKRYLNEKQIKRKIKNKDWGKTKPTITIKYPKIEKSKNQVILEYIKEHGINSKTQNKLRKITGDPHLLLICPKN